MVSTRRNKNNLTQGCTTRGGSLFRKAPVEDQETDQPERSSDVSTVSPFFEKALIAVTVEIINQI